jgi:hypothetical protein
MAKYLRRKDGMVFGWNEEMAKQADLEEFEASEQEVLAGVEAKEETEEARAIRMLGLREDTFQGYPSRGTAPTPDAPFGKNKPKHGTNPEGTVANPAPDPPPERPSLAGLNFGGDVPRADGTPGGLPDTNPEDDGDLSFETAKFGKRGKR